MGPLIIILIAVAVYCREACCDATTIVVPTTVVKPENAGLVERNESQAIEKGIFWKSLGLPRHKPAKAEESKDLDGASSEKSKRRSRFLDGLTFLAGLTFGGLSTAASSTVKTIAKLPQGSFNLNLGSSKASPYFAAYYSPYSLLPYPLFYPGPFGLVPMIDPTKPQTASHDDPTPQVISLFDNRLPVDYAEDNDRYSEAEKKSGGNRNAGLAGPNDRVDDRNAEEKATRRGCKEDQRKHGNSFREPIRERQGFYGDSQENLQLQDANTTDTNGNQAVENVTMPAVTTSPPIQNTTYYPPQYTVPRPFPGYFGGYPQNINHVDLTTDVYHYHEPSQINYNLPYERPANFYHDDKYSVYSSPHVNPPHFPGSFPPDQINEYVGTDFHRLHHPGYQSSYTDGFRPVK